MRHLLAIFAIAFALVACDDTATTAPTDTIPGPPDAPRLSVTVLTGTKAAPVDSPTVKVQWWYKDSVDITLAVLPKYLGGSGYKYGIRDTTYKVWCNAFDSSSIYVVATGKNGLPKYDSAKVYCKAP